MARILFTSQINNSSFITICKGDLLDRIKLTSNESVGLGRWVGALGRKKTPLGWVGAAQKKSVGLGWGAQPNAPTPLRPNGPTEIYNHEYAYNHLKSIIVTEIF